LTVFTSLEPGLRRNLGILFLTGLLFWASLSTVLPILPLYVKEAGGGVQEVGWIMGSFAIGLIIARPWLGRLADKNRKMVLLIGMTVVTLAPLGYFLTQNLTLLGVIRAFHGISIAAFATGFVALVASLSPERHRGELIGYMSLVNPIGAGLGPALGGLIQASSGFGTAFLFSASIAVVGTLCCLMVSDPGQKASSQAKLEYWRMLGTPRVRSIAFVMLLIGLSFGTLTTFVPLLIEETEVSLNPGLFYSLAAVSSFSIRLVSGPASDHYGRGVFITLSLSCYVVAMTLLCFAHDETTFLIAALVEGAGFGTLIPMVSTLMADRAQPQEQGRLFSLCMIGFDLGIGLAGPLFGSFGGGLSYQVLFQGATGLAIAALAAFLTLSSQDLQHSLRFALGQGQDIYALKDLRQIHD
jgi:MFS family permease